MKDNKKEDISKIVQMYVDSSGGVRRAAKLFGVSPSLVFYALRHNISRSSKIVRALVKKGYMSPSRYRVALEFSTKEEQQLMVDALKQYGSTRKEQSLHLLKNSQP